MSESDDVEKGSREEHGSNPTLNVDTQDDHGTAPTPIKKTESIMAAEESTLIDFDGPNDPYRPMNWPRRKKITVTVLYSLCTMGSTWASTM